MGGHLEGLTREEKKAIVERAQCDPSWWIYKFLRVKPWAKQREILASIRDNRRTACKACHAPGKSYIAAAAALWFLFTFRNSKVITTAPTWGQVENVLWRDIRDLYNKSPFDLGGSMKKAAPPKLELDEAWLAIGLSPNEPERFAGYHAAHMLVICDEASGIPPKIFEAIKGLTASGVMIRILLLGNPTRPEGELYDAFGKNRSLYYPITISAWDTPNLKPYRHLRDNPALPDQERHALKKERLETLKNAPPGCKTLKPDGSTCNKCAFCKTTSPQYVAETEEEYGLDSAAYKVRVEGEFPPDAPDQLIPLHLVEDAVIRWENWTKDKEGRWTIDAWWEHLPKISGVIEAGFDPARLGSDEAVLAHRYLDIVAPLDIWARMDTNELVPRVAGSLKRHRAGLVRVDEVGLGGGPKDTLAAHDGWVTEGFNSSHAARNPKRFFNLRAEAFWGLRDRFFEGRIAIPPDPKLIGQLSSIRYRHRPNGLIQIEPKEEAVKRGVRSPDRAEAVMMAFSLNSLKAVENVRTYGRMASAELSW